MSGPMLDVTGLNAWYGAAHILFDLSFHVGPGEVVALMGRNGAGKSTTIRTLMSLIARRSGTVHFCGEDISTLRPFEIARRLPTPRPGQAQFAAAPAALEVNRAYPAGAEHPAALGSNHFELRGTLRLGEGRHEGLLSSPTCGHRL